MLDALAAVIIMVLCQQTLRQLVPNAIRYTWQTMLHQYVPGKYRQHSWFKAESEVLHIPEKQGFTWLHHTIVTQSNLRSMVLILGVFLCLISFYEKQFIVEAWDFLRRPLFFMCVFIYPMVIGASAAFKGFHPDSVVYMISSIISVFVSMSVFTWLLSASINY